MDGILLQSGARFQVRVDSGTGISIGAHSDADEGLLVKALLSKSRGSLMFPMGAPVEERALARFVGKVGLEAFASRLIQAGISHEELVDEPGFDKLRDLVRRGNGPLWSVLRRQLYPPDKVFSDGDVHYELLHEYELLLRAVDEARGLYACYISLVIFGEEFVLNMLGPGLDGFEGWLADVED